MKIAIPLELSAPSVTVDELELFAARDGDIFRLTRSSKRDAWSAPSPVSLATDNDVSNPSISDDGLDLYMIEHTGNAFVNRAHRTSRDAPFTTFEGTGGFGSPDIAEGQLELYQQDFRTPIGRMTRATKAESFVDFTPVGDAVNDGSENSGPSISHDRLDLYFHSNRAGPPRIFVAHRADPSELFEDVELVELGAFDDSVALVDPEISADGRRLYFGVESPEGRELHVAARCTGE